MVRLVLEDTSPHSLEGRERRSGTKQVEDEILIVLGDSGLVVQEDPSLHSQGLSHLRWQQLQD